jgi:hypothetical protein
MHTDFSRAGMLFPAAERALQPQICTDRRFCVQVGRPSRKKGKQKPLRLLRSL